MDKSPSPLPDLLQEISSELVPPLSAPDLFDPVIEAYKKDVDRTLIRENLKLTHGQRLKKLQGYAASATRMRRAASPKHTSSDSSEHDRT